ncbi:diguanylate cyclase [Thalassotalea sp. G2M2-11]|uniref:diguanylate cyclase domain-containing protein n=1 Tax=Thalassotalea sp. G2M2-11 TaxID=2787627 RepID=UPI0019D098DA|nr:diguanylate cyclase [Thalassotalea sp. G2M2-11]
MSIRFRLTALMLTLFISATLNVAFTFWLEQLGEEKLKWVHHTHNVLMNAKSLLSHLKDAETGQRGYLLTEDTAYLQPYHQGHIASLNTLSLLKKLTKDNPEQQAVLSEVTTKMDEKFNELAHTISAVESGEKAQAYQLVNEDHGKQLMDDIRAYMATFSSKENLLLEQRKGSYRENRAKITTLIYVELAILICLAFVTYLFLQNSLFTPLKLLVKSAEKVEHGQKVEAGDIVGRDEMGNLLSAFYEMSQKVTEREQILDHKANHDGLTGLRNRLTVNQELNYAISQSQLDGDKSAVLFIDLNSFKPINDSLGHDFGDLILKETATKLLASTRSSDIVFRLGGDEFLVILKNINDIANVIAIIHKIQNEFALPTEIKGKQMEISISIGVSITPDDTTTCTELIEYADLAMYEAKKDPTVTYKLFNNSMLSASDEPLTKENSH